MMPYPYEETTRLHAPSMPWDTGFIERDGHQIYYEQSGVEDGIPVVFLHGGQVLVAHQHIVAYLILKISRYFV